MKQKIYSKFPTSFLTFLALILFGVALTSAQTPTLRANGKIAFTSDRDGNREIYTMTNDGTGQVRLTNNPGVDEFPVWSPDGRKIAFVSQNSSGSFAIKLMNANGTNQIQLNPARLCQPRRALVSLLVYELVAQWREDCFCRK